MGPFGLPTGAGGSVFNLLLLAGWALFGPVLLVVSLVALASWVYRRYFKQGEVYFATAKWRSDLQRILRRLFWSTLITIAPVLWALLTKQLP
jgi:hypothetical protein